MSGSTPVVGSIFLVFGNLLWLLQLILIVHVFKSGRPYWWFLILLMAPGIGAIAYLLVEVLPDVRAARGGISFSSLKPRSLRIRELRATLDETDVVDTRLALASELRAAGRTTEAHDVAAEALHGIFRNDPHTQTAVARYKVEAQRWDEALELIESIEVGSDKILNLEVTLLRGRALQATGRPDEAEEDFRSLEGHYIGEEPRYCLAVLLDSTGRKDEAVALWKEITARFRKASPIWRSAEKRWYRLSKARLKEHRA
jgi:hypothetical protein